jgi:hypothetical protein
MSKIDIGKDFYPRLANRDENQGDGKHTAIMFREKYLKDFDNKKIWDDGAISVELDFSNVNKIGPSFANEAFAYFTKYAKPADILKQIKLHNTSRVQLAIIMEELNTGYKRT